MDLIILFVMYLNIEISSKNKEEELSSTLAELSKNLSSVQEKLTKELADEKVIYETCQAIGLRNSPSFQVWFVIFPFSLFCQAAVDSLVKEREGRLSSEKSQASLSEELSRAQLELSSANQRVIHFYDVNSCFTWTTFCVCNNSLFPL